MNTTALVGIAATLNLRAEPTRKPKPVSGVHLFSKHLQFLDFDPMAAVTADMGFTGVDLTVRPGGHVEPAHAKRDLPRAAGLKPVMCTTDLVSVHQAHADTLLGAIADAGFTDVRLGWHKFPADLPLNLGVESFKPVAHGLADCPAKTRSPGRLSEPLRHRLCGRLPLGTLTNF
ncbi:MAG: hypothetical protein J6386_08585 [Candidatus Synoicihabitans palmerolidicus]|nr:hypothetical protein [Candidatus Synoicihabitans palmerolidicus]